jgi:hypothetical protein
MTLIRQQLEAREREILAPQSARSADTRGRLRAYGTLAEIGRQLSQQRTMEVLLTRADAIERVAEVVRRHVEPGMEVTGSPAESAVRFRSSLLLLWIEVADFSSAWRSLA